MSTITARYAAVVRLFALTGVAAPRKRTVAADLLCTCPADRLVRAVAWYARESARGVLSSARLCDGIAAIGRGWDDLYTVARVERGSRKLGTAHRGHVAEAGRAVAIRPASSGRWGKSVDPRIGAVRDSIELAAAWLLQGAQRAGLIPCTVHDDCRAHPELGAACAQDDAA